jgi:hypothetical protein
MLNTPSISIKQIAKSTPKNGFVLADLANQTSPDYPCQYHVTLDNKGILRMHAGEVPYWISDNQEWLKQEECVCRAELELQPNEINKERDPFWGIH